MTRANAWLAIAVTSILTGIWTPFLTHPAHSKPPLIPQREIGIARALCQLAKHDALTPSAIAEIVEQPADRVQVVHAFKGRFDAIVQRGNARMIITLHQPGGEYQQTRLRNEAAQPSSVPVTTYLLQLAPNCRIDTGRWVETDEQGRNITLHYFTGDPPNINRSEFLNPPIPAGSDPGGVAVAHVDSGVNYTLPAITNRLARHTDGTIFGLDLTDHDNRPYDIDPASSLLLPRHHGTSVASLLLAEAPDARLVPIRHPGRKPDAITGIVNFLANSPARIVTMPLGSNSRSDWAGFAQEAKRHPDILFVISAGNNGRNLDEKPVYPAAFDNENFLVVTSVDYFGYLPPESNWGPIAVDLAVPGERIEVIDHRGARVRASGASFAAPRIAALAARFSAANPGWGPEELKTAIIKLAILLPDRGDGKTRYGWLPNPAAVGPNPQM